MKKMVIGLAIIFLILFSVSAFILAQEEKTIAGKDDAIARALNALEPAKAKDAGLEKVQQPAKANITTPSSVPSPAKKIIIDTLELKDMDIADVLKLISQKSGLNIAAGKNVQAKVTIYLKDVDVWDALRIILETNDLAYEQEGNIIKVITARDYELLFGNRFGDKSQVKIVPLQYAAAGDLVLLLSQMKSSIGKVMADEKSNTMVLIDTLSKISDMQSLIKEVDIPVVTKVFNLSYAKAEEMEKKITDIMTKNVGKVRVDKRSNKVYVTDTPAKIQEVATIISAFDERHREVLIEAKIVKVILSDQFKMGVDWAALVQKYHNLDLRGSFSVLAAADKRGKLSIGTTDDYSVVIEALNKIGTTNTLSSPRITTINNEEAKILVGSTEPYVTTTTTTPASGPTTTAESVSFIDVGVKLFVTPTINEESYITMKIKPEVSSVTDYLPTSQNNKIPIVETSNAETTVMVKDGVTIVIGGLIKDELIETVNKVPLLGDIPLLGFVFRNKDKLMKKTELVVFLTPHIITGDYGSFEPPRLVKESEKP